MHKMYNIENMLIYTTKCRRIKITYTEILNIKHKNSKQQKQKNHIPHALLNSFMNIFLCANFKIIITIIFKSK